MDVAAVVADVDAALREAGTPERAVQEKRYLKSRLEHYGATLPATSRAVRDALRAHGPVDHDGAVGAAAALWDVPVMERRMAAVDVLEAAGPLVGPDDLPLVERLLRESHTWALVDGLAASVAGGVLLRNGQHARVTSTLDRWAGDEDFWVRRSALLAHLPSLRRRGGPPDDSPDVTRFERYADAMLEDKEFFVRKAIGWVLRDLGRRRPDQVTAWLLPRAGRAAGLTVREAVKHLPADQRAAVLAARAASPPRRT